jgi:hypothetical protein
MEKAIKDEIIALLRNGSTKSFVAQKYRTTLPNLYNWIKKNNLANITSYAHMDIEMARKVIES